MALAPSILVLGATGVSGHAFIQAALSQPTPPKLTLYVRSRGKLPEGIASRTRVVEGNLTDRHALLDAMEGVDTVVSFLGAYPSLNAFVFRTSTTPIADSFEGVISAMKARGVKRILALSTPSFSPASLAETFSWSQSLYQVFPKALVPQGNAEMVAIAERIAAESSLDWTIFRVPHLTTDAADLPVWAGLWGPEFKGSTSLSRESMSRWVLQEIEQRKWVKGAPALGNY